jgi:histidinol-phosphate/aromatic aminotransferase/cobyric acid decarboxylase-like protein
LDCTDVSRFVSRYGGYWRDDVLDFCYLTNPYFPSEETLDALLRELRGALRFYPSSQRVCAGYLGEALGVPAEWLYVGNGGSECIWLLNHLFPEPMLLPVPGFNEYENNRRALGAETRVFDVTDEDDFHLDVEAFVAATRDQGVSTAVVTSPNNPTGDVLREDELRFLLDETRHLALLVLDESFTDFVAPGEGKAGSALPVLGDHPHVAVLSSMSKDYGLPGLRLGYIASSSPELAPRLREAGPIWNLNALAEIFLERLPQLQAEYEPTRLRVLETTRALGRDLDTISFLRPRPVNSNFVFTEVLEPFDSTGLVRVLLADHGMFVNDCSNKANLGRRFVRIASRGEEDNARLVACLRELDRVHGRATS